MQKGDVYRHNKTGNFYVVLQLALDCNDPERQMVVYQSQNDGRIWVRAKDDFEKKVELEKKPGLKVVVPRFEKV